jgi:voltage-gated potassium channel Kch
VGHHTGMGRSRSLWEGHVIVCGLQGVGLRTVEQLHQAGVGVVVVDDEPDQRLVRIVEAWDIPYLVGSPRVAGILDQVTRPGTVLDVAALAAPAIVEACLGSDSYQIELAGTRFITAEVAVNRFASLRALFGSLAPIAVVPADGSTTVACPGRDQMVSIGDRVTVLGTRDELAEAGLATGLEDDGSALRPRRQAGAGLLRRVTSVLGSDANHALRLAMVAALALVVVSVVVLRLGYRLPGGGHMPVLTALYFTVETTSTVGFGDFSFAGQSTGTSTSTPRPPMPPCSGPGWAWCSSGPTPSPP